jgi:hypothetical protein
MRLRPVGSPRESAANACSTAMHIHGQDGLHVLAEQEQRHGRPLAGSWGRPGLDRDQRARRRRRALGAGGSRR